MSATCSSITHKEQGWEHDSTQALSQLIDLVHRQLSLQTKILLTNESFGNPLQTRTLVNQTYLRMLELGEISFAAKSYFFTTASSIMRRVLVAHARAEKSRKRDGAILQIAVNDVTSPGMDIVELDEAMAHLGLRDWMQARIVELRYFGGLGIDEAADVLSMSPAAVKRKWTMAQDFLPTWGRIAEA